MCSVGEAPGTSLGTPERETTGTPEIETTRIYKTYIYIYIYITYFLEVIHTQTFFCLTFFTRASLLLLSEVQSVLLDSSAVGLWATAA